MNCKTCGALLPSYAYMLKMDYCNKKCQEDENKPKQANVEDLFWGIFKKK